MCVVCYKKGERSISECEVKFIQDQLIHGYTIDNFDFPCGLCDNSHHLVQKNIMLKDAVLPEVQNYDPKRPLLLRGVVCTCKICTDAKVTIVPRQKEKRGRPKTEATPILRIYAKCFARVGDKPHDNCSSRRAKIDNVQ